MIFKMIKEMLVLFLLKYATLINLLKKTKKKSLFFWIKFIEKLIDFVLNIKYKKLKLLGKFIWHAQGYPCRI